MSEDIKKIVLDIGKKAREASYELALLSSQEKNNLLLHLSAKIASESEHIVKENKKDLENAKKNGLSKAMIDRLKLDDQKVLAIANSIKKVADLPDPVGHCLKKWNCPNGVEIEKRSVPIGVIGIIYESRPNVTSDAASLCLKAGNATILRGGKEAFHSNMAISKVLKEGCREKNINESAITLIPNTSRESVRYIAEMEKYLDLIIPRGGQGLIETVVSLARMPVIKHYNGICHLYVHENCDIEMALDLALDSKAQKPSVCNALETLLIDQKLAKTFLPKLNDVMQSNGVELRGDKYVCEILNDIKKADEKDWEAEYLDMILAVKIVKDISEAIDHINKYGSHHTDTICTKDSKAANIFINSIDSSAVFWNISTRFNDGEEFGFGAEIGISTDKLHARGPMALDELTSYKYVAIGNGQTKANNSNI